MVVATDLGIPKLTLYVGDLHPDVTEAVLFERFSRMGPLSTVHVCRDVKTKKSLCYAYVNFQRPEDAARALKHMNYDTLKGRVMRLMWVERDRSVRRPNPSNLFIKNLDKEVTSRDLYQLLSNYGQIVSCKAAMEGAMCKGYGFAQFSTPQEASAAVAGTNGMVFKGKPLYVGPFVPKSQRVPREKTFRNLYVKNLPADMGDEHLDALFTRFGTVTSAKVMRDSEGQSRRHGFVCFAEHEAAAKALRETGGSLTEGNGEPLIVTRAQTKAERSAELKENYEKEKVENSQLGVNLYVKHLAETMDDEELHRMFTKFGTVTSAKVARDAPTGRSRRFGYVSMATPEQAARAIKELHVPGQLYVGYWQPKSTRVANMQARNMQQLSMMQRDRARKDA